MRSLPYLWGQTYSDNHVSCVGVGIDLGQFGEIGKSDKFGFYVVISYLGWPKDHMVYISKHSDIPGISESFSIDLLDKHYIGLIG